MNIIKRLQRLSKIKIFFLIANIFVFLLISNKEYKNNCYIMKNMYTIEKAIPIKNLIRCVAKSKREIKLSNGTIIHAITSTSPDSLKNHKSDMIILDEFSHTPISSVYELMTVVNKLVDTNPNMKLIIASVPNGINYFYKLWADAISNFNDYHAIKIPYTVIPHRDETWKQLEIAMLGKEKFEQEYECVFHEGTKGDLYA